jgi:hypothetical protein
LYQLLNKLNNLRDEILSITIIYILLFMYHVSGLTDDCVYGEKAIGVWIQQSQGWQVNNPKGRASHVIRHIYILYENK